MSFVRRVFSLFDIASYAFVRFAVWRDPLLAMCVCVDALIRFPAHKTRMNRNDPSMFIRFCVPVAFFHFDILAECVRVCVSVKNDVLSTWVFLLLLHHRLGSLFPLLSLFRSTLTHSLSLSLSSRVPLVRVFFSASARYFQICHILIAINLAIEWRNGICQCRHVSNLIFSNVIRRTARRAHRASIQRRLVDGIYRFCTWHQPIYSEIKTAAVAAVVCSGFFIHIEQSRSEEICHEDNHRWGSCFC